MALLPWTSPRVEHVPTTVGNLVERLRGLGGGFRGRGRRKTVWIVTVDRGRGRFRATGRRCARGRCAAEDVFFSWTSARGSSGAAAVKKALSRRCRRGCERGRCGRHRGTAVRPPPWERPWDGYTVAAVAAGVRMCPLLIRPQDSLGVRRHRRPRGRPWAQFCWRGHGDGLMVAELADEAARSWRGRFLGQGFVLGATTLDNMEGQTRSCCHGRGNGAATAHCCWQGWWNGGGANSAGQPRVRHC